MGLEIYENAGRRLIFIVMYAMQSWGTVISGVLVAVGVVMLIAATKNPHYRQRGFRMMIAFSFLFFMMAYSPVLYFHYYGPEPEPNENAQAEDLMVMSDATSGTFVDILEIIGYPVLVLMFNVGLFYRLLAGKSPQSKRMGIGLMMFSPVAMFFIWLLPTIFSKI